MVLGSNIDKAATKMPRAKTQRRKDFLVFCDRKAGNKALKRWFDMLAITMVLPLLFPIFVLLWCLVRWDLGSPVFFAQFRPGLYGKPFRVVKFRTMTNCFDEAGCLLPDAQRLTRLGRFLRATSLDELPELINVITGKMSIVGPRPLLMQYLGRYSLEQARRHEVKPGITGWAQVNGRNSISWEEKFRLDVWYVDNWSFMLDLQIIAMTVLKVIKREGISADGEATAAEFMPHAKSQRCKDR